MYASSSPSRKGPGFVTLLCAPGRNRLSALIWLQNARFTATTASTWAAEGSFTTLASRTVYGAGRWRRLLSNSSRMATPSRCGMTNDASIAAKWWTVRDRAWANSVTIF